jgi:hypothetical protein
MRHLFRIAVAGALVALAQTAAPAASAPLTINVPVSLTNISRDFDSFTVACQLTWTEPLKGSQFVGMTTSPVKLVDRGFHGTVTNFTMDTNAAQKATLATCNLTLLVSTDSTKHYKPGVDELVPGTNVPAADLPVGTPKFSVTVPLP